MILSSDEFIRLRTSDKPDEYRRSAYDEASHEVWVDIINRYPGMRIWVAHNKTVPIDILHILSNDRETDVRLTVASKRKLSRELFEQLSADEDASVRQRIAYNKKVPRDILEKLASDSDDIVRDVARKKLGH